MTIIIFPTLEASGSNVRNSDKVIIIIYFLININICRLELRSLNSKAKSIIDNFYIWSVYLPHCCAITFASV